MCKLSLTNDQSIEIFKVRLFELYLIAVPLIFILLSQIFFEVIDCIIVAQQNPNLLPVFSFAMSVKIVVILFSTGVLSYTTVLFSRYERILVLASTIHLSVGIVILCLPLYYIFSHLLVLIKIDQSIIFKVMDFLYTRLFAFIFLLRFVTLKYYVSFFYDGKVIYKTVIFGLIVKIFTNFVVVNYIVKENVVQGIAIAGNITDIVMYTMICIYTKFWNRNTFLLTFQSLLSKSSIQVLFKLIRYGLPVGFAYVFEVSFFSFLTLLMGFIGSDQLIAYQINLQITSFLFMFCLGLSEALTIKLSKAHVDLNDRDILIYRSIGIFSSIILSCIFIYLLQTFSEEIISIYIKDDLENSKSYKLAIKFIFYISIIQLFDNIQIILNAYLKAAEDTFTPMLIYIFSYYCVGIPTAYFLSIQMRLNESGVWYGVVAAITSVTILLLARFLYKKDRFST